MIIQTQLPFLWVIFLVLWYVYLSDWYTSYSTWPLWRGLNWKNIRYSARLFVHLPLSEFHLFQLCFYQIHLLWRLNKAKDISTLFQRLIHGAIWDKIKLNGIFVKMKLFLFKFLITILLDHIVGTDAIGLQIIRLVFFCLGFNSQFLSCIFLIWYNCYLFIFNHPDI